MLELTSTIDDVFHIEGRGCVVAPGIPIDSDIPVKIGDHLYIMHDGSCCLDTIVQGIEMISGPQRSGFPILLAKSIEKSDIPIGGTLHLISGSPQDGTPAKPILELGTAVSVRTCARNTTPHIGIIDRRVWHYKFQLWYYWICAHGRRISKRYTAADLFPKRTGG